MTCSNHTVHKVSWLIVHIRSLPVPPGKCWEEQSRIVECPQTEEQHEEDRRRYLLPNVFTVFKRLKIKITLNMNHNRRTGCCRWVGGVGGGGGVDGFSIHEDLCCSVCSCLPTRPFMLLLFGPEPQEYHGNIKWSRGDPNLVSSIKPLFTWGKVPRGPSDAANLSRLNWKSPSGRGSSQVTGDWHDASPARHELIHRASRANGRI